MPTRTLYQQHRAICLCGLSDGPLPGRRRAAPVQTVQRRTRQRAASTDQLGIMRSMPSWTLRGPEWRRSGRTMQKLCTREIYGSEGPDIMLNQCKLSDTPANATSHSVPYTDSDICANAVTDSSAHSSSNTASALPCWQAYRQIWSVCCVFIWAMARQGRGIFVPRERVSKGQIWPS